METRKQQAKEWLKKDTERLEQIRETGSRQQILTLEARIRIHQATIDLSK